MVNDAPADVSAQVESTDVRDPQNLTTNTEETAGYTGKGNNNPEPVDNSDDNEDDVEDDDFDLDDDDFDIDYTMNARRKVKKESGSRIMTIPELFHLVDLDVDLIQTCRLLLCQVIWYHSNSRARGAITNKNFTDFSQPG